MKAYKYILKLSVKIIPIFESWLALLCELYNAAIEKSRNAYRINRPSIDYKASQLSEIKKDRPKFDEIHPRVIQNALKRVAFAFESFFPRVKVGQISAIRAFASVSGSIPSHIDEAAFGSMVTSSSSSDRQGQIPSLAPDRRLDQNLHDQTRSRRFVVILGRRV